MRKYFTLPPLWRLTAWLFGLLLPLGAAQAQYLTENFESTFSGATGAPSGWTQTAFNPAGTVAGSYYFESITPASNPTGAGGAYGGSGNPTTPRPGSAGTKVLGINDYNLSTGAFRRINSDVVNLSASTNPYIKFWYSAYEGSFLHNFQIVASNNGTDWTPIMYMPNYVTALGTWTEFSFQVPTAFRTATARFGIQVYGEFGSGSIFVDDFVIEENQTFTTNTFNATTNNNWNTATNWSLGVVPTFMHDVVIPNGRTVVMDIGSTSGVGYARCHNLTINESGSVTSLTYSATSGRLIMTGDLTITAATPANAVFHVGTAASPTGTLYVGGNITNGGTLNMATASGTTGASLHLFGGNATPNTFTNTGTVSALEANSLSSLWTMNPGGATFASPLVVKSTLNLGVGATSGANLTLGKTANNSIINRWYGSLSSAPTFVAFSNTNRKLDLSYNDASIATPYYTVGLQQNKTLGNELPLVGGFRHASGTLTMNTHGNVVLADPLMIGDSATATTSGITLTRGIIVGSANDYVYTKNDVTTTSATNPSTTTSPSTHGSYIIGRIRAKWATTSGTRNFPLGLGSNFNSITTSTTPGTPANNLARNLSITTTTTANNQEVIASLINSAPTGTPSGALTSLQGNKYYRVQLVSANDFVAGQTTITISGMNTASPVSTALSDNILVAGANIRLAQSTAPGGTWVDRTSATGGAISNNSIFTRSSSTAAGLQIGPLATNGEYFAFAGNEPYCAPPTTFVVNSTTGSTANITYSGGNGATDYEVQYRRQGGSTWTQFTGNPVSGNTVNITGLKAGTTYEYQVRVNCSASPFVSAYSATQTFTTTTPTTFTANASIANATYTPLTGAGTVVLPITTPTDDGTYTISTATMLALAPEFEFTWAGVPINNLVVSNNGHVTMNGSAPSFNTAIGTAGTGVTFSPFWEDLVPSAAGTSITAEVIGTYPNRQLVVEWTNEEVFSYNSPSLNFQVIFNESNNSVQYAYGVMQGFDGNNPGAVANGFSFSYAIGIRGNTVSSPPTAGQVFAMSRPNDASSFTHLYTNVANQGSNNLTRLPNCDQVITFTQAGGYAFVPRSSDPFPAPANDELGAGAIVITPLASTPSNFCGSFYHTQGATTSTFPPNACTGVNDDDVWFTFIGNTTGRTKIALRSGGGFDGRASVHLGDGTQVGACYAPGYPAGAATQVDTFGINTVLGEEYYIRVYSATGGTQAVGTANISGGIVTGVTITTPGSGYVTSYGGAGITNYPKIYLVGGDGTGAHAYVTALTSGGIASGNITIGQGGSGYTVAPTVYIAPPGPGLTGDFSLQVYAVPTPPANDEPAGAKVLTLGTSCTTIYTSESSLNATATATPASPCVGNADDDVWFKFVAATTGQVRVAVEPTINKNVSNMVFQVVNAGPTDNIGTSTSVVCVNNTGLAGEESAVVSVTAGNTYYVRVYHSGTQNGAATARFSICAYTIEPLAYEFTESMGTYTPITGGIQLYTNLDVDANVRDTIRGGFTFNGVMFKNLVIGSNGYITLEDAVSPNTTNVLGAAGISALAGFAQNLVEAESGTPEIRRQKVGSAYVYQWQDVRRSTSSGEKFSFQIRIDTATNAISYIYDVDSMGTNTSAPQVGIHYIGTTNLTGSLNRTSSTGWNKTTTGTSATSTITTNAAVGNRPADGQTFTYTPTLCNASKIVTLVTTATADIGTTTATVRWRKQLGVNGYEVTYRKATEDNTVATWTTPIVVLAPDTTAALSSLEDGVGYVFQVRTRCTATDKSHWSLPGTFTTKPQPLGYTFSQSTTTYAPLATPNVLQSGVDGFDDNVDVIDLGAVGQSVQLNGKVHTQVTMSANGYIIMGSSASAGYTPLTSTTGSGIVSAFARDLDASASNASTSYGWAVVGSEIVFEWKDVTAFSGATYAGMALNFQIRYNTTNQTWSTIYGPSVFGTSTSNPQRVQVGLRGPASASLPDNVIIRRGEWLNTTSSYLNSDSVYFRNAADLPPSGLRFTFTPTACKSYPFTLAPAGAEIRDDSVFVKFNKMATATAGYELRYRKMSETNSAATWTSPVSLSGGVSDTSAWLTGLTPATTYIFEVRGNCGGSSTYWGSGRRFRTLNPDFDVKAASLIYAGSSCPTATSSVVVRIQNTGTKVITAGTILPATVQLTGPLGLQTQSASVTVPAGGLAVNAFINDTITGFSLSAQGKYPIYRAYTSWGTDALAANDTVPSGDTIRVSPSYTVGYAYGFEDSAPDYAVSSNGADVDNTWTLAPDVAWDGGFTTSLPPQEGSSVAFYDAYNITAGQSSTLYTPCFDITDNCSILQFYMSQNYDDFYTGGTYATEGVRVRISTDNGLTYNYVTLRNLATGVGNLTVAPRDNPSSTAEGEWTEFRVDLGAYAGQTIKVAFEATSRFGLSFGIDNIRLMQRPPVDVGILAFTSPQPPPTCASNNAPITVTIRNYGCAAQTNIPVQVSVTGPVTQTYNDVYTGTLNPGQSVSYTIANIDMSAQGSYAFNATTQMIGDGDLLNDATVFNIQVSPENAPPIITATALPASILVNTSTSLTGTSPADVVGGVFAYTSPFTFGQAGDSLSSVSPGPANVVSAVRNVTGLSYNASDLSRVRLNVRHTWRSDMMIYLFAPNGSRIRLINKQGGSGPNDFRNLDLVPSGPSITTLGASFDGVNITTAYSPQQPFSNLTGSANGNWTLRLVDSTNSDGGRLLDFALEFPNRTITRTWTQLSGPATITGFPFTGNSPGSRTFNTPGNYVFRYTATYSGGCSNFINVPVTVSEGNVWLGLDNSSPTNNWNTPANWAFAPAPPPAGSTVVIPDTAPNAPVIGSSVQVANIVFKDANVSLPNGITVATGGTLDVKGNITGKGTLMGPGTIIFSGTGVQQVSGNVTVGSFSVTNTNLTGLTTIGSGSILRIMPGGTLTMGANARLTVPANGSVILSSDATGTARLGVMPASATINGKLTLERYVAGSTPGWYFVAAPFRAGTSTLSEWNELPARVVPKNNANIFEYTENDTTRGTYNGRLTEFSGWKVPSSTSNTFNPLDRPKGYRAYLNANFFGSLQGVLSAKGAPFTQNVTAPYTRTTTAPGGYDGGGWNLLANPYPSEIDWNAVRYDATNSSGTMGSAIHIYQGATANYGSYTALSPTTGISVGNASRYIASSQSFFIKATASGNLVFKEAHKNAANANTFTRQAADENLLKFRLKQGNNWDEAAISFMDGASRGQDAWDANNPGGSAVDVASTPVTGLNLAINLMPAMNTQTETIPLMILAANGQTEIRFTGMDSFAPGTRIYLRDNMTGTLRDLSLDPNYTFTVTADPLSRGVGRLELVFEPASVTSTKALASTMRLGVAPNPASRASGTVVEVANMGTGKAALELRDVLGRVVYSETMNLRDGGAKTTINLVKLSKGSYILKVTSSEGQLTEQVVVE